MTPTDVPPPDRVCVIGAGVSGLAATKVMLAAGFDVDTFEEASDLGGTWHPDRTYPLLHTNDVRDVYRFSDHPYPADADEYPTAAQVRAYLHGYAERFDLGPHLRFDTTVQRVERLHGSEPSATAGDGARFRVTVQAAGGAPTTHHYDEVVVCNGVFSEPNIPRFDGDERFDGPILHSSEVGRDELEGRRVVVVGGGKSAYDLAEAAAAHAASCTLVFRSAHWLAPRRLIGLRADWFILTRFVQAFLPYHTKHGLAAVLHRFGAPVVRLYWWATTQLLRFVLDAPDDLEPAVDLPLGFQDIAVGTEVYDEVRAGRIDPRRAEVDRFIDGERIRLDTGATIAADVVVCATGFTQQVDFLSPDLRAEVQDDDGFFTLYRHILPPRERHLGFVGYASSIGTTLSSEVASHWLAAHFHGRMELPAAEVMDDHITRVKAWAQDLLPREGGGHAVAVYLLDYLDELLGDLDVEPRRSDSRLAGRLGPVHAERFSDLGAKLREHDRVGA